MKTIRQGTELGTVTEVLTADACPWGIGGGDDAFAHCRCAEARKRGGTGRVHFGIRHGAFTVLRVFSVTGGGHDCRVRDAGGREFDARCYA